MRFGSGPNIGIASSSTGQELGHGSIFHRSKQCRQMQNDQCKLHGTSIFEMIDFRQDP